MSSWKLCNISTFAVAIVVSLWAWSLPASSGSPSPIGRTRYLPIESISYSFGSKSMSGYFIEQAGTCHVTLMIIERSDPERLRSLSAARVRLALNPGQIAGLDSKEGRSLNFTCGEGATTLLVDIGERDKLMEL